MSGENVGKIKFTLNGKEITLSEGERLGRENRKLKDLGSLWEKIDVNGDKHLDKNEFILAQKLNQLLSNNGQWNSSQMKALAGEFEASGQEVGDFLDFKLKEKAHKPLELKMVKPKIELPEMEKPKEIKYDAERLAKIEEEKAKKQREAEFDKEYVVKSGDSLSAIAQKVLKAVDNTKKPTMKEIMALVYEIADINGIERKHIDDIRVDQKLLLPEVILPDTATSVIKTSPSRSSTVSDAPQEIPVTKVSRTVSAENFESDTLSLNNVKYQHKTKLLDIAQDSLGLYEITFDEYKRLLQENPEELNNTQYRIIGKNGNVTDQWCAHTVSYFSLLSGMDIGSHKKTVQAFINWAGNDYKSIETKSMTRANYIQERAARAEQIKLQLPEMQEGDFIVWKANKSNNGSWLVALDNGEFVSKDSSHIGFIEAVDVENGIVTVIEGNANVYSDDGDGAFSLVTNWREGVIGGQMVGEFQEVNKRDGLIRKQYTIEELAALGYSGYIDNSNRVELK